MRCDPTLVIGMGASMYTGIATAQIVETMTLLGVQAPRRVEVFDGVKQMGKAWCEARNAARATA